MFTVAVISMMIAWIVLSEPKQVPKVEFSFATPYCTEIAYPSGPKRQITLIASNVPKTLVGGSASAVSPIVWKDIHEMHNGEWLAAAPRQHELVFNNGNASISPQKSLLPFVFPVSDGTTSQIDLELLPSTNEIRLEFHVFKNADGLEKLRRWFGMELDGIRKKRGFFWAPWPSNAITLDYAVTTPPIPTTTIRVQPDFSGYSPPGETTAPVQQ